MTRNRSTITAPTIDLLAAAAATTAAMSASIAAFAGCPSNHTATFENSVNLGGWTFAWFGQPTPLTFTGGNPGGMLRLELCCDSFSPQVATVGPSAFTGDFRAGGVTSIAVDVRIYSLEPQLFPLSLRLETDAGTPGNPDDDFAVFFNGGPEHDLPPADADPQYGEWWTIQFDVPSQSPDLPRGWAYQPADPLLGQVPPGADWNVLIHNVKRVSFEYGPIIPVWPIHYWDLAIDNVEIVREPKGGICGDITGDGSVNVADLLALIAQWGACEAQPAAFPADLDSSGAVNVADLLLLIGNWG